MHSFIPTKKERPAKCFCCKKPLFCIGDSRHVPEYELKINDHFKPSTMSTTHFVHVHCWFLIESFIENFRWIGDEEESS